MAVNRRIQQYGVWVGKPVQYIMEKEDWTRHIHVIFTDHKCPRLCRAAINVKSWTEESRLVFWLKRRFLHPITSELALLDSGFLELPSDELPCLEHGLDYIRTPGLLFPIGGTLLDHYSSGTNPNDNMLSQMEQILDRAIQQKAIMYLFGARFDSGDGIHEIHMNQGSVPRFPNDVCKDGALLFRFPDGHWEAVFLAFGSQKTPTDDETGLPLVKSESLAEQLEAVPLTPTGGSMSAGRLDIK